MFVKTLGIKNSKPKSYDDLPKRSTNECHEITPDILKTVAVGEQWRFSTLNKITRQYLSINLKYIFRKSAAQIYLKQSVVLKKI